jgi:hypothetical protein
MSQHTVEEEIPSMSGSAQWRRKFPVQVSRDMCHMIFEMTRNAQIVRLVSDKRAAYSGGGNPQYDQQRTVEEEIPSTSVKRYVPHGLRDDSQIVSLVSDESGGNSLCYQQRTVEEEIPSTSVERSVQDKMT